MVITASCFSYNIQYGYHFSNTEQAGVQKKNRPIILDKTQTIMVANYLIFKTGQQCLSWTLKYSTYSNYD
jgi:hypothetical protein